jgi:NAD(P)-dependent dehydrogenase (short-subunit alcohol dehydrogenase family)
MSAPTEVALIVGAGDGTGGAIARQFAEAGFHVCAARRDVAALEPLLDDIRQAGGSASGHSLDAREEDQVLSVFADIEKNIGPLTVVVYNAAIGARKPITELKASTFRNVWETDCFAAFLIGREAARVMQPRQQGSIFFTGATSATRGRAQFAAFAAAKSGARALAQSMARELGPKNIHVAHVVIDAAVDTAWIRGMVPDFEQRKEADGVVEPDDLAANYVTLYDQPRNAWTFEMDVRPWTETW